MSKHTPGPWVVDGDVIRGDQQRNGSISVASMLDVSYPYGRRAGESKHANARLIAAAPDHHAVALELDRLMLVIESAVRRQDPSHSEAVVAMLKANRAAIAKATGEHHD